ncbi:MAG: HEPN domain-containing protein [Candidatus Woesearchaeota archaeon]
MLNVKEATDNFKSYLDDGLLTKIAVKPEVVRVHIKNAKESLEVAALLLQNDHSLWTIVSAYYAMFYMANAVLNKLNYKVGSRISHKVAADALVVLVRDRLKRKLFDDYEATRNEALQLIGSDEIIESFELERIKRSNIQYSTTDQVKKAKAITSFERAKRFVFEMEGLISCL